MATTPNPLDDPVARAAQKKAHAAAQNVPVDLDGLLAGVHTLTAEAEALRGEVGGLTRKIGVERAWRIGLGLSLLLDLGVTAGLFWLNHRVEHNSSVAVVNCRATVQVGKGFQDTFGPFLTDRADDPSTPDVDEHEATIRFRSFIQGLADKNCD